MGPQFLTFFNRNSKTRLLNILSSMLQFRTPASNGSQTTTNRASSPSRFPNLMSPDFQGREQSQNWRRGCLSNICGKKTQTHSTFYRHFCRRCIEFGIIAEREETDRDMGSVSRIKCDVLTATEHCLKGEHAELSK